MSRPRKPADIDAISRAIVALIAQDLPTDPETVASECAISRRTLSERTNDATGESPGAFIARFCRLSPSVELLIGDDRPGRLGVDLSAVVRGRLLSRAAAEQRSISALVAEAVTRYLEDMDEPDQAA